MELVSPSLGLVFWMLVTFSLLLFLLKKFAWKPLLTSLKEREESIENSLQQAENARAEMARLQSQNEALLAEARLERDQIVREAREMKEKIINDAKVIADEEGKKLIARANDEINKQKLAALDELKKEVAGFSVQIAEKLVSKQLDNNAAQQALIAEQLSQLTKGQSQAG
ncbi:MAG: F0F1 ATP synthase subunit B [Bacteroidetes bacterium]|nr:F0F1 ATP synthase subunit B [Bacteroidota bacterium]